MIKQITIAAIVLFGLAACSDAPTAERVLREQGYTNIKTNGYSWFSCGKEDKFATEFTAISPSGKEVNGAVCSGFFKGSTIRFN